MSNIDLFDVSIEETDIAKLDLTELVNWYCLLVSGEYKQGQNHLRVNLNTGETYEEGEHNDGRDVHGTAIDAAYCCLGVYYDGLVAKGLASWSGREHENLLPDDAAVRLGCPMQMGSIQVINPELTVKSGAAFAQPDTTPPHPVKASELNDSYNEPFTTIAGYILAEIRRRAALAA